MKVYGVYSFWKLLALCLVFLAVGSVSAIAIEKVAPPPAVSPQKMYVNTDRNTYHIGENLVVLMGNTQGEDIKFGTKPFGLHFEKLVNGKWENVSVNSNYSCYPSLSDTLSDVEGEFCKASVTWTIGEEFNLGKYRVVSSGTTAETLVEAYAEFDIASGPPVFNTRPEMSLTIDKNTYEIGDKIILIIDNLQEETIRFENQPYGLRFERLVNGEWEPVSVNADYTYYPSLNDTVTPVGTEYSKVFISFVIGQDTIVGTYKVISSGKIGQIVVEATAEFNIVLHVEEQPLPELEK